jgi:hypothetical protein
MAGETAREYLNTSEAARLLGISPGSLQAHRCRGTGPAFSRIGRRVVYAAADLHGWVEAGRRTSTRERDGVAAGATR